MGLKLRKGSLRKLKKFGRKRFKVKSRALKKRLKLGKVSSKSSAGNIFGV